ncbi:MAG TPA: hypothetical protein VFN07_00770 [Trueperaceae bacterium]|nr:hypothetical protein [Trueperaceae bacterium]HRP47644.1 hypothetical protein [Trueperaceae bacterium]
MNAIPTEATVAGKHGVFVVDERHGLVWEVSVPVTELIDLIEACGTEHSLEVASDVGVFYAMARRWWVLPLGDEMLVRIELERSMTA